MAASALLRPAMHSSSSRQIGRVCGSWRLIASGVNAGYRMISVWEYCVATVTTRSASARH
jgi:hypothetical protein